MLGTHTGVSFTADRSHQHLPSTSMEGVTATLQQGERWQDPQHQWSLSAQGAPRSCRGMAPMGHPTWPHNTPTPPPSPVHAAPTPHPLPNSRRVPGGLHPPGHRAASLLPGTATLDTASGWLSVSTLTCWKPLQVALCRCLCPGGTGWVTAYWQLTVPQIHHLNLPSLTLAAVAGVECQQSCSSSSWAKQLGTVQDSDTSRPPCPKASLGGDVEIPQFLHPPYSDSASSLPSDRGWSLRLSSSNTPPCPSNPTK